jgi:hypothetical protein
MNQKLGQIGAKESYEPPTLTTISLRPEEAVLGACKISGGSGPAGNGLSGPCAILLGGCQPLGS